MVLHSLCSDQKDNTPRRGSGSGEPRAPSPPSRGSTSRTQRNSAKSNVCKGVPPFHAQSYLDLYGSHRIASHWWHSVADQGQRVRRRYPTLTELSREPETWAVTKIFIWLKRLGFFKMLELRRRPFHCNVPRASVLKLWKNLVALSTLVTPLILNRPLRHAQCSTAPTLTANR